MVWTAFLWGVGVSCGAAVGLLLFFLCFWSLEWACGRAKRAAELRGFNIDSLAALRDRNRLTEDTNNYASRIAFALEDIADSRISGSSTDETGQDADD